LEISTFTDIKLDNIDLVLLDLDNTLYPYDICHNAALERITCDIAIKLGLDQAFILKEYYNSRKLVSIRHAGQAAAHSRLLYIQGLVETLIGKTDPQWILYLNELYWEMYFSKMELYEDTLIFLQKCQTLKVPIIVVTDLVAEIQLKKILHLSISNFFSFIVTSEEAAREKPHPSIFELAIQKSKLLLSDIRQIAVVGDNPEKDLFFSDCYQVTSYLVVR